MKAILGGAFVLVAALAWSTAGLFTRIVSTDIPTTLFGRSLTGGICVFLIYVLFFNRDRSRIWRFTAGEIVISLLSAAGMMCFISAFFFTSIANVTFLYGMMPLVTLLLSVVILRQRPTTIGILCCFLAAAGVAVIVWNEKNLSDWLGFALAFGMTFFMAALTVSTKVYPEADVTKATYLSAFLAALMTLPFTNFGGVSPVDGVWLTVYGVVNVGLGFGVYLLGVSRIPALAAALIGLVEIPLAPVWALLLFGEEVGVGALYGGTIVFLSAFIYILSAHVSSKESRSVAFSAPDQL